MGLRAPFDYFLGVTWPWLPLASFILAFLICYFVNGRRFQAAIAIIGSIIMFVLAGPILERDLAGRDISFGFGILAFYFATIAIGWLVGGFIAILCSMLWHKKRSIGERIP